jgi:MFS family permease
MSATSTQGTYRRLLATPHATSLLGWSLLARLPLGMAPLGLIFLARGEGVGYGAAGALAAAYGLALAVGAPIAGRLVDRRGAHGILLRRALAYPSLLALVCLLAATDAPVVAIGVAAALAGFCIPPVAPTVRTVWPRLVPDELRGAAYGLEAAAQELFFIVGPLIAALLSAVRPAGAIAGAAIFALVGTLLVARLPPVREMELTEPVHHGLLGALASPGVRAICLFAVFLGLAFGMVELGFPALAEAHGARELGGVALAAFSLGSLLGGVLAGLRATSNPEHRFGIVSPLIGCGLLLLVAAWSVPTLALFAFVAGLPIAPTIAAAYGIIDRAALPSSHAESFAWFGTSVMLGAATGFAVGGAVVDLVGVRWTFVMGSAVALLGAMSVIVRRRPLGQLT